MRQEQSKAKKKNRYFDYTLLFVILFLVAFGLIMLYSTSAYNAQNKFNDPAYYFKKQLFATVLGLAGMFVCASIPYQIWKGWSPYIYLVSLGLSTAVLFIGEEYNGAKRWLDLGFISFQPAELAKLAVIIFVAAMVSRMPKKMSKFSSIVKVIFMVLPIFAVVGIENLSTAIIILGVAVAVCFVASKKYNHFILAGGALVAVGAIFILLEPYRLERLDVWLHPETNDKGYQTLQGLYAIGSGGLFGKGLGESIQKLGFVPEAQNDMIFSIICEELGLFGAICVIMLFLLMIWRLMIIANNAQDLFGSLLAVGIMAHISIQVILNVAVVTNTIPNTGITLPFISYGGTSVLFLMAEMGIALSVSRGIMLESGEE